MEDKELRIERVFDALVKVVWKYWTEPELLDQWWAPEPWKAKTKHMEFREGGYWLYSMNSPEGEQHWSRADFKKIVPQELFEGLDYFCDEDGNKNTELPTTQWRVRFTDSGAQTKVEITVTFASTEEKEKMIKMGMKEGLTMTLENLNNILKKQ